jgi:hypothetical protein
MDPNRLTTGEKVLGASALLLFLLSFFGFWAKVEAGGITLRFNAWDAYGILVKLPLLLALVAIALVVARAADAKLSIPWGTTYLGVAGVSFLFMLIALLIGPDESASAFGVEVSRGLGLFLGTLLTAAMAAGAWMHYSESPGTTSSPAAPDAPPPAV